MHVLSVTGSIVIGSTSFFAQMETSLLNKSQTQRFGDEPQLYTMHGDSQEVKPKA